MNSPGSLIEPDGILRNAPQLGSIISEEAGRFGFLLERPRLTQAEKKKLNRLIEGEFEKAFSLHSSLRLLTQFF